jgi:nucleoside-diphosphate-sugar epimerase
MTLRVAITGATGFIGSAILEELLRARAQIIVLLREESDCHRIVGKTGFEPLIYHSLRDQNIIEGVKAFQPNLFIHCAWRGVSGDKRNEDFQILDNIPLTLDSVTLANIAGCKQWIGLGSQAEYGNQNIVLDEGALLLPTTIYGRAKLSAGIAALALCDTYEITGTWMRVFSTYGPGDAPSWFIPYVLKEFMENRAPKLTGCEQLWDYLHVSDAARAVVAVASKVSGGIFNLGSGTALQLKNYIELIRIGVGSHLLPEYGAIPYRSDQVMHLQADIRKLEREVGWRPIIQFREGIKEVIEHEIQLKDIKSEGVA